jgi:hypothetical protein
MVKLFYMLAPNRRNERFKHKANQKTRVAPKERLNVHSSDRRNRDQIVKSANIFQLVRRLEPVDILIWAKGKHY